MKRAAILPAAFLISSCASSYLQREFVVETIDTGESSVPAVVILEDQVQTQGDGAELRTPTTVTVRFKRRADGVGWESVKLGVKSVKLDEEGKVIGGLRKGEPSAYQEDFRAVYPTDAKRQLFILHRRRAGQ